MASLRRDDATNARFDPAERPSFFLFSYLLSVRTRSHRGKKEEKEETKNRPRFAPPTPARRKKRRFDHTFEPRWRQPEWPGGEKADFKGLSFLPEIRVIAICPWNKKIVEQSEGGRGYYALKERVEKFPCRKAYAC